MLQGATTFGTRVVPRQPVLKKLADRRDLPPRVRHILTGLLGICTGSLAHSVGAALDEYEHELPRQAVRARSGEQSRRWLESLREFKRARDQVTPRFLANIEDALARFDEHADVSVQNGTEHTGVELSLVETGDLELSLAAQELATKSEIRQSLALLDLGHRFGILAGQPAFEAERVALGPAHVLRALRDASSCLDLPAEHRVLFCHAFDRVTLSAIGTFYETLNAFLVEQRILRHLRVHAPLRPKSKGGSAEQHHFRDARETFGERGEEPVHCRSLGSRRLSPVDSTTAAPPATARKAERRSSEPFTAQVIPAMTPAIPIQPATIRGLDQGNETVRIEPRGTRRTDPINNVDFRVEKTFPVGASDRRIGIYLDIFNINNQGVIDSTQRTGVIDSSGSTFGNPNFWISPRLARLGFRFTF